MRSYKEICESIGFDRMNIVYPKHIYKAIGYCKGVVLGEFDDEPAAKRAGATVVESFWKNETEFKEFKDNIVALEQKATSIWFDELQDENLRSVKQLIKLSGKPVSETNINALYSIVYNRAYQKGHSSGYDEVANCMDYEISYLQEIFEAL